MGQARRVDNPLYSSALRMMNYDANRYLEQEQYELAEGLYLRLKNHAVGYFGQESLNYGNCLYNLAILYHCWQQFDKAETYYIQAYGICGRAIGLKDSRMVPMLYDMGQLYHSHNMFYHAEIYYKQAMDIIGEEMNQQTIDISTKLGTLYYIHSKFSEAEEYYRLALKICDTIHFNTCETVRALNNLSTLYYEMKRNNEANHLKRRVQCIVTLMNDRY